MNVPGLMLLENVETIAIVVSSTGLLLLFHFVFSMAFLHLAGSSRSCPQRNQSHLQAFSEHLCPSKPFHDPGESPQLVSE
ncbi:hypothetical protein OS493_023312 [Desmophyllum pertusum]|uniref:Uncharacterized protein n=1 Tax=Desmophyllum pertusum TaxID=174260 RepID=A0A9W9YAJ3_9CNID|nr:hypothetical protein OS493_023312 [Desmophyllum pertusum]